MWYCAWVENRWPTLHTCTSEFHRQSIPLHDFLICCLLLIQRHMSHWTRFFFFWFLETDIKNRLKSITSVDILSRLKLFQSYHSSHLQISIVQNFNSIILTLLNFVNLIILSFHIVFMLPLSGPVTFLCLSFVNLSCFILSWQSSPLTFI